MSDIRDQIEYIECQHRVFLGVHQAVEIDGQRKNRFVTPSLLSPNAQTGREFVDCLEMLQHRVGDLFLTCEKNVQQLGHLPQR